MNGPDPGTAGVVPFHGVPTFFRACCMESAVGGRGYERAGYHLAIHIANLHQDDYDRVEDFRTRADELLAAIESKDAASIWRWFRVEFPRCIMLVPARRKATFVLGVLNAHKNGKLDL